MADLKQMCYRTDKYLKSFILQKAFSLPKAQRTKKAFSRYMTLSLKVLLPSNRLKVLAHLSSHFVKKSCKSLPMCMLAKNILLMFSDKIEKNFAVPLRF
ncbi:MAG: hypothetical protein U1E92_01770 [Moraxella osloensis]